MEEEALPVSLSCVEVNSNKLAEVDEKGVEDPKEGKERPVGMSVVVCQEVEQERLDVCPNVKEWQKHIEDDELECFEDCHSLVDHSYGFSI